MQQDIKSITGTITLADGTTSDFQITSGTGGWQQWGAPNSRLSLTVEPLEAMTNAVYDYLDAGE